MRTLPAGKYYLRVHGGEGDPDLPALIQIHAPIQGQINPTTPPDRDEIHGGDGDDLIIGNQQLDRLFGESGDDAFVAEPVEIRDLVDGEYNDELPPTPQIVMEANLPSPIDPVIPFAPNRTRSRGSRRFGHPDHDQFRESTYCPRRDQGNQSGYADEFGRPVIGDFKPGRIAIRYPTKGIEPRR